MDDTIRLDTEAVLAELRQGWVSDEIRDYLRTYYRQFSAIRRVDRLLELIREKFGVTLNRRQVYNIMQDEKART